MLKFAKILICTILMVAILSVPCFATNDLVYGHYISPGTYTFSESLNFSMFVDGTYYINFDFVSNDSSFGSIRINVHEQGVLVDFDYFQGSSKTVAYRQGQVSSSWTDDDYRIITFDEGFYIYDPVIYSFWVYNVSSLNGYSTFLDEMLSAFGFVGTWITEASSDLALMFWDPTEGALTFVGTLTIAALAVSVCFLVIGFISRFLRFKS